MSSMWKVNVRKKSGSAVELDVLQKSADAGSWDNFLEMWVPMAVASSAFKNGQPTTPLGESLGSFAELFDQDVSLLNGHFEVSTAVEREVYTDENRAARLVEAGLTATAPLTADVVAKIGGRMKISVIAKSPDYVSHMTEGANWEF